MDWRALCPESCVPKSTITVFFLTLSGKLAITQVLSLERAEAPCPGREGNKHSGMVKDRYTTRDVSRTTQGRFSAPGHPRGPQNLWTLRNPKARKLFTTAILVVAKFASTTNLPWIATCEKTLTKWIAEGCGTMWLCNRIRIQLFFFNFHTSRLKNLENYIFMCSPLA